MKKSTARKLSLSFTIGVSLLAVLSASIATYTWYQAEANATVTANSTSTTITTTKPNDFVFYGYRGNTDPSHEIGATDVDSNGVYDFNDDFETITSSNLAAKTNFDGGVGHANKFNPGDVKCFALYFSGHTSGTAVQLQITNMISQTMNDINASKHRYDRTSGSNVEINVGWTMNAYSLLVTSLTNHIPTSTSSYSTFATSANGNSGTDRIILSSGSNVVGKNGNTNVNLGAANFAIDLYPSTTVSATEGFIFYTIVFEDAVDYRFKEVNSSSDVPLLVPSTDNTRYFLRNTSSLTTAEWNSNCYTDLLFALTTMNFIF